MFGKKLLFSAKLGKIWSKLVVLGHVRCVCAKLVVFGQIGLFREKWLYLGKVIVFGQSSCILARWLYSGKVLVIGQK